MSEGAISDLVIRDLTSADIDACVGIFSRAWSAGHPYAPRVIDRVVFEAETIGERVLVAVTGEGIAGFVSLYEPERFVHHLYVEPALKGRGIGRGLLDRAVALVGGQASLKCQLQNADALAFYRRLGWRDGETGEGEQGPWIRMVFP